MPPSYKIEDTEFAPERPQMGLAAWIMLGVLVGGTVSHVGFRQYYKGEIDDVVQLKETAKAEVRSAHPKTREALHRLKTAPVPPPPHTPATADVKPLEVVVTKGSQMDAKIHCKTEPLDHPSGERSNITQCIIEHPPEDLTDDDRGFMADMVGAVIGAEK